VHQAFKRRKQNRLPNCRVFLKMYWMHKVQKENCVSVNSGQFDLTCYVYCSLGLFHKTCRKKAIPSSNMLINCSCVVFKATITWYTWNKWDITPAAVSMVSILKKTPKQATLTYKGTFLPLNIICFASYLRSKY
jgi:hypothetical protein